MRMKSTNIVISFFLIAIIFSFGDTIFSQPDPYPNIEIPIMEGSYNVRRFINRPKGTKSLNYYIKAEYPADKVLQFYDSEFKANGWIPSNKEKKQWEYFVDSTMKDEPKVKQLLSFWTNQKLQKKAFLALKYVKVDDKWSNELHVICQIQPLSDRTKLYFFIKKLDESGNLGEFMEMINFYRMANGDVDINKAIKENPNNKYLKEYKKIVSELK